MSGVLVLGAGGHGKVVADILLCQGIDVLGFLDDDPASWGTTRLGLPVLGAIATYHRFDPTGLALGIGSNAGRQSVVAQLGDATASLWCNAVHPRATVAGSVRLGRGVVVAAGVVVNPDTIVGDHVILNTGCTVDHDCEIGAYSHIAPGSHLAGGVRIGEGAFMGIGSVITPYRSVGEWTTVGAGAAVVTDIPAKVVAKGVPARW